MSFRFLGIFIFTSVIFTYILLSPLISNLEFNSKEADGTACSPQITRACFLSIKAVCFDYVSPCTIPEGWFIQNTRLNAWVVESD